MVFKFLLAQHNVTQFTQLKCRQTTNASRNAIPKRRQKNEQTWLTHERAACRLLDGAFNDGHRTFFRRCGLCLSIHSNYWYTSCQSRTSISVCWDRTLSSTLSDNNNGRLAQSGKRLRHLLRRSCHRCALVCNSTCRCCRFSDTSTNPSCDT